MTMMTCRLGAPPHILNRHVAELHVWNGCYTHDAVECAVRNIRDAAVIGIDGGVADQDVDLAELGFGFIDKVLQRSL